jgi:hypothetical protein
MGPLSTPEVVFVRPGDILVVGPPGAELAPESKRKVMPEFAAVQLRPQYEDATLMISRTLGHVPTGAAFALFAPFPWQIRRVADLATLPEMLVWYAVLAAAVSLFIRERSRWRDMFPIAGVALGLLGLLSLVEGNYGTLYRHRAVLVAPWVVLLACPVLSQVRFPTFRAARSARDMTTPADAVGCRQA